MAEWYVQAQGKCDSNSPAMPGDFLNLAMTEWEFATLGNYISECPLVLKANTDIATARRIGRLHAVQARLSILDASPTN